MNIDRLLDTYYSIDELCELLKERGYLVHKQYSADGYRHDVFIQNKTEPVAKFGISLVCKSMAKKEYNKYKKRRMMLLNKKDPRISYLQLKDFIDIES